LCNCNCGSHPNFDQQQGILLFKELRQLSLLRRIGNDKSAYLFAMGDQTKRELRDVFSPGRNARDELKYTGLIFHDLRRTGVRNMLRAGIPERVAMTISGHKTRAIFDRYHIVAQSDLADAARKLEINQQRELEASVREKSRAPEFGQSLGRTAPKLGNAEFSPSARPLPN